MAFGGDILASWRHPRRVLRRKLALPQNEGRLLAYLYLGCVLIFASQVFSGPMDAGVPGDAQWLGALFAWLFIVPLAMYGLAALARLLGRAIGGTGSWYSARLALFWSLLAVAPIWLAVRLISGLLGPSAINSVLGGLALASFFVIWIAAIVETESRAKADEF